jgi:hypothetical protein
MKVVSFREWNRHQNTKDVLICSQCSFCQHIMIPRLIVYLCFVICSRQLYYPLLAPETKSILFSELFMGFISVSLI